MPKTLQSIHDLARRRLFKFDIAETPNDIVLSNVWSKDYKPTAVTADTLSAIKAYAQRSGKIVHVAANSHRVFDLIYRQGFYSNLVMTGKDDISTLIGSARFLYSWRPQNGSQTNTQTKTSAEA